MNKAKILQEAKLSLQNGFKHHDFYEETKIILSLLQGNKEYFGNLNVNFEMYKDVLAPSEFRSMQNEIICLITIVCREAIKLGANQEFSFAISDYFICNIEKKKNKTDLEILVREVFECYYDLIYVEPQKNFSKNIAKAIHFIKLNIYDSCTVEEISKYIGLNPRYFSTIFKKEVGIPPSLYIRNIKMKEAEFLLKQKNHTITYVADVLGYCSISYFSSEFKKIYGVSPTSIYKKKM